MMHDRSHVLLYRVSLGNQPHCNHKKCGKCVLYTNADEDDERAMREAGFEAAATVAESVKIDVNGILKKPPAG